LVFIQAIIVKMSGFSGRLQGIQGSAGRSIGYGRSLPQGGFQSIDRLYAAEEQCKVRISEDDNTDPYGNGTQDVQDYVDNPSEDDNINDETLQTNLDKDTTTVVIDNESLKSTAENTPKLKGGLTIPEDEDD